MKSRSSILLLLVAGLLLPGVPAQNLTGEGENGATPIWSLTSRIAAGSSNICGATFEDTNATGIFYINPNVLQGPQEGQDNTSGKTLRSGLAVTIQSGSSASNATNDTSSSYGLWYNTNGANYSGDFALGYDVCALVGFSLNYNTQLRGQDDDGTCSSALDSTCIADIAEVTQQWADWLTTPNTIGAGSNLTNTSLPALCNTLAANVRDNFPTSCSYFFQDSALDGLGWPLTSNGDNYDVVLNPNCTINDNGTWQNAVSLYNNDSQAVYTAWSQAVTPILFAFMPVADAGATTRISSSVAELTCLHINQIREGSYDPPDAPAPTPVAYNVTETPSPQPTDSGTGSDAGLTAGAIAGVAVGSVAGVAAIASGLLFWLWRKRRARKSTEIETSAAVQDEIQIKKSDEFNGAKPELPGESSRYELGGPEAGELDGKDSRHQLPATEEEGGRDNRQWLDGVEIQRKRFSQEPVELP